MNDVHEYTSTYILCDLYTQFSPPNFSQPSLGWSDLDLVVKDEVLNQVHVCAWLVGAVLLENFGWNTDSHTMTGQGGHHHRTCSYFAAGPNFNGPQNADTSPKQNSMTCIQT